MAAIGASGPSSKGQPPSEQSSNLDTAILVAKVGCVALAVIFVLAIVLAAVFAGAWAVVLPAMAVALVAMMAFPVALHILCEASLGQASLAAQQGTANGKTQESKQNDRSKMSKDELNEAHLAEKRKLIQEQVRNGKPKEEADLEIEELELKQKREFIEREYGEELEKIEKGDGEKSNENSTNEEIREEAVERQDALKRLESEFQEQQIENDKAVKVLEFKKDESALKKALEEEKGSLKELIEARKPEENQKAELYKVQGELHDKKRVVLRAENDLALLVIGNPGEDQKKDLKEKIENAKKEFDDKEKEFNRLKAALPRDPESFLAKASEFMSKHKPTLPSISWPSFRSSQLSSSKEDDENVIEMDEIFLPTNEERSRKRDGTTQDKFETLGSPSSSSKSSSSSSSSGGVGQRENVVHVGESEPSKKGNGDASLLDKAERLLLDVDQLLNNDFVSFDSQTSSNSQSTTVPFGTYQELEEVNDLSRNKDGGSQSLNDID